MFIFKKNKQEGVANRETFLDAEIRRARVHSFLPSGTEESGEKRWHSVDTYTPGEERPGRGDKTGWVCCTWPPQPPPLPPTYVCDHLNFRIANSLIHGDAMAGTATTVVSSQENTFA